MTDVFTPYEDALRQLLGQLGKAHPLFAEATTFQGRLLENIAQARRYGDNETRRSDRAQIREALDRLAQGALDISFTDLVFSPAREDAARAAPPVMAERVFLAYSHEDQAFAHRLAANLRDAGVPLWVDRWDIPAGADWAQAINEALYGCGRFLIVLSPAAVDSPEVQAELCLALDEKKPVVPVLYQRCRIPYRLRPFQYVDFTSRGPDDQETLGRILQALGEEGRPALAVEEKTAPALLQVQEATRQRQEKLVSKAQAAQTVEDWATLRRVVDELQSLDVKAAELFAAALAAHEREERARQARWADWYSEAKRLVGREPQQALDLLEQLRAESPDYTGLVGAEAAARRTLEKRHGPWRLVPAWAWGIMGLIVVIVVLVVLVVSGVFPPWDGTGAVTLTLVDELFPGDTLRAVTLTERGVLLALKRAGVRRMGGQVLEIEDLANLLEEPFAVAEGLNGELWVGTRENGLVKLTPEGEVERPFTQTDEGVSIVGVYAIALDESGGVWVAKFGPGEGIFLRDATGQWHHYYWETGGKHTVEDIKIDRKGQVWVATHGEGLHCLDPDTEQWAVYNEETCAGKPECLPDDNVLTIHITADDRKWVGTTNGLCVLGEHEDERWLGCVEATALPDNRVRTLADDGEGHIFVGTEKGLVIVDEERNIVEVSFSGGSLDGDYIYRLAFDRNTRRLWVGELEGEVTVWSVEGGKASP